MSTSLALIAHRAAAADMTAALDALAVATETGHPKALAMAQRRVNETAAALADASRRLSKTDRLAIAAAAPKPVAPFGTVHAPNIGTAETEGIDLATQRLARNRRTPGLYCARCDAALPIGSTYALVQSVALCHPCARTYRPHVRRLGYQRPWTSADALLDRDALPGHEGEAMPCRYCHRKPVRYAGGLIQLCEAHEKAWRVHDRPIHPDGTVDVDTLRARIDAAALLDRIERTDVPCRSGIALADEQTEQDDMLDTATAMQMTTHTALRRTVHELDDSTAAERNADPIDEIEDETTPDVPDWTPTYWPRRPFTVKQIAPGVDGLGRYVAGAIVLGDRWSDRLDTYAHLGIPQQCRRLAAPRIGPHLYQRADD